MAAITDQPKNAEYYDMRAPSELKGSGAVPPSLEYLSQLDQLLIRQQVELLEVVAVFKTQNRYVVQNSMGQQMMFVQEECGCWERKCCGRIRGFTMHVTNNNHQDIMRFRRECSCSCCWCILCCKGCASEVIVESPPGNIIGFIRQEAYCWNLKVGIYDETHNRLGIVKLPSCPCTCCCCPRDVEFPITNNDETTIMGKISKQWAGCVREALTNADHFQISVNFPVDLDVKVKALMFAATFLVEFLEFQHQDNNDD